MACFNVFMTDMLLLLSRYNGRQSEAPSVFPDVMEEACAYVEAVVDAELRKRKRFPLEWDGETTSGVQWRANVAASNMYEGAKETVGFVSCLCTREAMMLLRMFSAY
jgi:hypothetical protein